MGYLVSSAASCFLILNGRAQIVQTPLRSIPLPPRHAAAASASSSRSLTAAAFWESITWRATGEQLSRRTQ